MNRVIDLQVQPVGHSSGSRSPQKQVDFRLKFRLPRLLAKFDWRQPLHWLLIFALLATITTPILEALMTHARYDLRLSNQLLGNTSPKLAGKISYDEQQKLFQFNKEGIKKQPDPNGSNISTGGDSKLYSADLPVDSSKGVKIYDNVNNLSIGFTPQFKTLDGKQQANRVVYPLDGSWPQLVYTAKANGLKEDLVIPRRIGDSATFKYQLNLGNDLEARMVGEGVGIYSADPRLFGNITYGSDADRAKVEAARKNGTKSYLAFYIPAPQIKQNGKSTANPAAKFSLDGNVLTVTASGLKSAAYPLSIDPSFLVTTSNDLRNGNTDGGIDFDDTNGQILRGGLTGGTVQSFGSPGDLLQPRISPNVAVYNNCFFAVGGSVTSGSYTLSTDYGQLTSGSLTWHTAGNATGGTAGSNGNMWRPHVGGFGVALNGYLYVVAGDTGGNGNAGVEVAKINTSNCSIGAWTDTTTFTAGGQGVMLGMTGAVYNGYIYAVGGFNGLGGVVFNTVEYAKPNLDGTISSWTTSGTTLPEVRSRHGTAIYNGYLYIAGGMQGALQQGDNAVKFIKLNSDGSLGTTWVTTTAMPANRAEFGMYAHDGYLYAAGGAGDVQSADVVIAPIYANGTIGAWQTTTSMINARYRQGALVYSDAINGAYLFEIGGSNGSTPMTSVEKAKIDVAGFMGDGGSWSSGGSTTTAARLGTGMAAYNGYLYVVGGCNGASCATISNIVDYVPINSDGSLGTWSTTTGTLAAPGRAYVSVVAYNGTLYAVGGCTVVISNLCTSSSATTERGSIGSGGNITSFSVDAKSMVGARDSQGLAAYNGYLYVAGGGNANNALSTSEYAPLNNDGSIGSAGWTSGPAIDTAKDWLKMVAWNGYLYYAGGNNGTTYYSTVYKSAIGSNGVPGSWTDTTANMTITRAGFGFGVYNGYLYAYGGRTTGGGAVSSTEYTKVNSDSTLAGWSSTNTKSMSGSMYYFGAIISNGVAYQATGSDGTNYLATASYQYINNGGFGTIAWTSAGSSVITSRDDTTSAVVNGYMYVIAGCTLVSGGSTCKQANISSNVQYSAINADGSVSTSTWPSTSTGPTARFGHATFVANGRIYVMGGCDTAPSLSAGACTHSTSAIQYVTPDSNGNITATWTTNGINLPTSVNNATAVYYNGYVYLGGTGASIYYAPVNSSTGAIGTWNTTTASPITSRTQAEVAVYNGYLYLIGGCAASCASSGITNGVEFAPISATGDITASWTATTSLVSQRSEALAQAYDGFMYVYTGYSNYDTAVQVAPILANGKLGNWIFTNPISTARSGSGGAMYNGVLYLAGGIDAGGSLHGDVQYAAMAAIPRTGHYSRLLDTDVDVTPTKLVVSGTSAGSGTVISATYQTATSSSNSLSNTQTISTITLGTPTASLTTVSGGVARYYFINYTFDDSLSAVFPDSSGQTTITDFNLYYHPASAKRLRGGKTFTGNVQQSLDASP